MSAKGIVLHPCAVARCPALLPPGQDRCADHRSTPHRHNALNSGARGYDRQWQIRARLFRQRYPLCGMRPGNRAPVMSACYDRGRRQPADCVDHVQPHRHDYALFWDETGNWQSLCASCHGAKTAAGL